MSTTLNYIAKPDPIKGELKHEVRDGKHVFSFSDDFETRDGPDLKIFLSPQTMDSVTGDNATEGSLNLGFLESNTGASEYVVPAGTDMAQFKTVLIHCEKYAALWGGANL